MCAEPLCRLCRRNSLYSIGSTVSLKSSAHRSQASSIRGPIISMIGNWKPEGRKGCKECWHVARKKHQASSERVAQSARFHIARLKEKGISHFLNYRSRSTNDRPPHPLSLLYLESQTMIFLTCRPRWPGTMRKIAVIAGSVQRERRFIPRPYRGSGPKQRILESAAVSAVIALLATSHAAFSTPNLHARTARGIRQLYRK